MEGVRFDVLDEEEKKRYIKGDRGTMGKGKASLNLKVARYLVRVSLIAGNRLGVFIRLC